MTEDHNDDPMDEMEERYKFIKDNAKRLSAYAYHAVMSGYCVEVTVYDENDEGGSTTVSWRDCDGMGEEDCACVDEPDAK